MKNDLSQIPTTLHRIGFQIDALAYMIEQLGSANSPPERPEDVFYGISLLLDEHSKKLKLVANTIEGTEG